MQQDLTSTKASTLERTAALTRTFRTRMDLGQSNELFSTSTRTDLELETTARTSVSAERSRTGQKAASAKAHRTTRARAATIETPPLGS